MLADQNRNFGWKMRPALESAKSALFFTCGSAIGLLNSPTDSGPFVYRLGHQVFNLGRGVQLPYGLPFSWFIPMCWRGIGRILCCMQCRDG